MYWAENSMVLTWNMKFISLERQDSHVLRTRKNIWNNPLISSIYLSQLYINIEEVCSGYKHNRDLRETMDVWKLIPACTIHFPFVTLSSAPHYQSNYTRKGEQINCPFSRRDIHVLYSGIIYTCLVVVFFLGGG